MILRSRLRSTPLPPPSLLPLPAPALPTPPPRRLYQGYHSFINQSHPDWRLRYADKVMGAQAAIDRFVKSEQRLYVSSSTGLPQQLMHALVHSAPSLSNVEVMQLSTVHTREFTQHDVTEHVRVNAFFVGGGVRRAVNEGRADFTPVFLSAIPGLFKNRDLPLDVALLHLSPPDEHGYCSFGVEVGVAKTAAHEARFTVAEINPRMPRTLGDSAIHVSKLHALVPVDYAIPEGKPHPTNDSVTERIADHVASLIPDRATLQMGIGGLPDAVLARLHNHKDLGIHTELFSDGVIDLVEKGVITGEAKTIHQGKIIAGFIVGSQRLYDFVHDNPMIEMHPAEYVNDPFIIAQNPKMVAVNSAIEIDLQGQVCSESHGTRVYSGVGGQVDFIYGASRSPGGVPIIAMPSTFTRKDGTKGSKIVSALPIGSAVTTTRSHVHYVVTEHGIASLKGKTLRERVHALIQIADPAFREKLEKEAHLLELLH